MTEKPFCGFCIIFEKLGIGNIPAVSDKTTLSIWMDALRHVSDKDLIITAKTLTWKKVNCAYEE